MKILAYGEVLWDIYPDDRYIGGAVMNFSAHAARLGANVYFASAVGDDDEGRVALNLMSEWGINTDYVAVSNTLETGKCLVTLDEKSIPTYNLLQNVAYDRIPAPLGNFDVLCFGTLSQRNEHNFAVLQDLLKKDYREVFADINIRPPFFTEKSIALCLENATILKVSDEELHYISELIDPYLAAKELKKQYPNLKLVIVTQGENGAFVFDGENYYSCDGINIDVKSTVGAGDSFSAAFLVKFLNGADITECLNTAVRLSSFVVSQQAAVPEYDGKEYL